MPKKIIHEEIADWETFLKKLAELKARSEEISKKEEHSHPSRYLFRGQKNDSWVLESTLERITKNPKYKVEDYYWEIYSAKPQIETFTGKTWGLPSLDEALEELTQKAKDAKRFFNSDHLPIYEYMTYLRHHGFPSPFLDWTRSPFIAAHFAFNHIESNVPSVSIFVFQEMVGLGKMISTKGPYIETLGPTIKSHERHFLQQCEYTFCVGIENHSFYYGSYENVNPGKQYEQDFLWKFTLPATERPKVLKYLDEVNLNSFSLFNSEEGLMDTMAIRAFHM